MELPWNCRGLMETPSRGEGVPWRFPCPIYERGRFCTACTTSVTPSFRTPKDLSTCIATSFKDIMRIRIDLKVGKELCVGSYRPRGL